MKPLADILRQLGLELLSPPTETDGLMEEAAPIEAVPIPPGLMDLFKARVKATHDLAHAEWPQRGQILRLEKPHSTFEERPFAVLLTGRTTTPNVWAGYVVAPESELDYSAEGDLPLAELVTTRDPMAGIVQTWNPVRAPIPSATACLAWLDLEAMDHVTSTIESATGNRNDNLLPSTQNYRVIYGRAAEQWTTVAAHLDESGTHEPSLFARLTAQLANLAQVASIGQWHSAVEHPMGPDEDQQLIWNLADLEIRFDSHSCDIRKVGADDRPVQVNLLLDDLLLEAHALHDAGESVAIPLPPRRHMGKVKLTIRQAGGIFLEVVL